MSTRATLWLYVCVCVYTVLDRRVVVVVVVVFSIVFQ